MLFKNEEEEKEAKKVKASLKFLFYLLETKQRKNKTKNNYWNAKHKYLFGKFSFLLKTSVALIFLLVVGAFGNKHIDIWKKWDYSSNLNENLNLFFIWLPKSKGVW